MDQDFNQRIRQIFFLLIVVGLAALLFSKLYIFFPGFLGALTLYILCRKAFFKLTIANRWKKGLTALLFILLFVACIVAPVYFSLQMIFSKIEALLQHPEQVNKAIDVISAQIKDWTGQDLITQGATLDFRKQIGGVLPRVLNGSATMLGNLLMILFLSFFMFQHGRELERKLHHFIPLRNKNIDALASETVSMVRANAIGVPLMSLIQGLCAIAGYWFFGVKDFVLLGLVTGLFSFFPIVGTAVIWVPVVIYLFSAGDSGKAIGLGVYCLVVVGNVDYLARVTFLRKVGNVHPVTTILGLIAGLRMFGFWGFIFGPLMISLLMLLIKIYRNEFVTDEPVEVETKEKAG